jgi:hypothetical protein
MDMEWLLAIMGKAMGLDVAAKVKLVIVVMVMH